MDWRIDMKEKMKSLKQNFDFRDIIIFIIPFVTYLIILAIFFPGMMSYDSFDQLNQIATNQFNNWHPFLHTFIEKMCMKVWNTPASVGVFQICFFSILWTVICRYNRKKNTKKEFALQIIVTLLIVLNPLNSFYSITLWKDVLFGYMFLLFCFLLEILIDREYEVSPKFIVLLGFVIAIISKLRHNGLYALVIFLIILMIIFIIKKNWKFCLLIVTSFITSMVLFYGLEAVYHVKHIKNTLVEVKIIHALAYYNEENILSEEDKTVISKIVSLKDMHDNFNKYYSDALAAKLNLVKAQEYKSDLMKILIQRSLKHPLVLIRYVLDSANMTWSIIRPSSAVGTLVFLQLDDSPNNVTGITHVNKGKGIYQNIQQIVLKSMYQTFPQTVLYSGALYLYLAIILVGVLIVTKKSLKFLLLIIPNILNTIIIAASTPIQDIRYIYPNYLILYLVLIIFISNYSRKKQMIEN